MDPVTVSLALALIEKILVYGAPAVISAIQNWEVENPTVEDIKKLQIIKDPEEYFK